MHVLQRLPSNLLLPVLLHDGFGNGNPLLKMKQLGVGKGQLGLRRDQGGRGGLYTPFGFG